MSVAFAQEKDKRTIAEKGEQDEVEELLMEANRGRR
jgi:hypothetical protein